MTKLSEAIDLSANLLAYGHFFVEGWLPENRGSTPSRSRWMRTQPFSKTIASLTNGIGQTALGLLREVSDKSATKRYGWFKYDTQLKTHGFDDHDDHSRFCNFCDYFLRRSELGEEGLNAEHRHPHYGYLKFVLPSAQMWKEMKGFNDMAVR
ncbi:hypothetical protein LZ32DRAFT_619044 [Colletotrichum eremochloae]|nr:hypothetical protein LZ32DRAFT_619044 [Colletotrichum eremochloae]